jgi:hypothetical protein
MTTAIQFRRIRQLMLDPANSALVTTGDGRYLTDRHVIVCLSGLAAIPGWGGILAGLPDGVYSLRASQPPVPDPRREPVSEAVEQSVRRLQSVQDWRPVTATRWARLGTSGVGARHILARHDTAGPHATAADAGLWHRWNAVLADRTPRRVTASQPEARPGHALRMEIISRHAPAVTVGYIVAAHVDDDDRYPAEYLAQRTAL